MRSGACELELIELNDEEWALLVLLLMDDEFVDVDEAVEENVVRERGFEHGNGSDGLLENCSISLHHWLSESNVG